MKLPRNISASELVSSLLKFGYKISRQKGSHLKLTTLSNRQHHITIPNNNPIKLGTLSSILGRYLSILN
ncbi:MAG: type II toxin-antitoxin system HicA family toxin [Bacteroidota bacterium]|nr:type II toxin-antitoxin system HicA family toxin [Bacteroidota bacterium]